MIIQNLQLQLYLSEEKIIFQGEKGTHVRFIINGSAQVYLTRQVPLNQIRAVPGF
jgi:CRP-like cAMP-binding protein